MFLAGLNPNLRGSDFRENLSVAFGVIRRTAGINGGETDAVGCVIRGLVMTSACVDVLQNEYCSRP